MKKLLREYLLDEVDKDVYNLIRSKYNSNRIIMSKDTSINFKPVSIDSQDVYFKPKGLWYGIGTAWIDWVRTEMPDWESDNVFLIDIDTTKIKVLSTLDEIIAFNKEYGVVDANSSFKNTFFSNRDIDWRKVASEYSGFEISPYIWKARNLFMWYSTFDIASGCIWDGSIIKQVKLLP